MLKTSTGLLLSDEMWRIFASIYSSTKNFVVRKLRSIILIWRLFFDNFAGLNTLKCQYSTFRWTLKILSFKFNFVIINGALHYASGEVVFGVLKLTDWKNENSWSEFQLLKSAWFTLFGQIINWAKYWYIFIICNMRCFHKLHFMWWCLVLLLHPPPKMFQH